MLREEGQERHGHKKCGRTALDQCTMYACLETSQGTSLICTKIICADNYNENRKYAS
jgi:hypothetical protein